MKECDNSKIHISSNFILSVCLLMLLDTALLRPSLHCNTSLHFTILHPTTLHYTYRHFTSSHLHFTTLSFGLTHLRCPLACVQLIAAFAVWEVHVEVLKCYAVLDLVHNAVRVYVSPSRSTFFMPY